MDFKDYYKTLGVARDATHDQIRRAYRKLARKFHPDVSKEPNAEARFKDVAEAHEALSDTERRAAYDEACRRHERGEPFDPPPGWSPGADRREGRPSEADDFSDFFSSLFGRAAREQSFRSDAAGADSRARIAIALEDVYRGARRTVSLRIPTIDAQGRRTTQERQLDVDIPKGIREGQQLRLAGQGGPGRGSGAAGDLYLEIVLQPHPRFRVEGADVSFDLPVAPWEAALGATVAATTPDGEVHLTIPPGSHAGRKLRLKGRGLPGRVPGDLYALIGIELPPSDTPAAREAWEALAKAFPGYDPRAPAA